MLANRPVVVMNLTDERARKRLQWRENVALRNVLRVLFVEKTGLAAGMVATERRRWAVRHSLPGAHAARCDQATQEEWMTSNTSSAKTTPSPLDEAARPRAAVEVCNDPPLTLCVLGFNKIERQLLEGTVKLSQRRKPRLEVLGDADAKRADVILIDALDVPSLQWAQAQPWLSQRTVIWVDSKVTRPGHTVSKRPVQWPILPMLLARALESSSAVRGAPGGLAAKPEAAPAPRQATPATVSATATAAGSTAAAVTTTRHVLVVDDSLAVRNHLRSLLEARGIAVTEVSCVKDALDAVTQRRFDCALMDVLMPDVDGYEGCKRLKAMKSSIGQLPVVMLTSKSSPFDRIRGKMSGCDAYLTKPVQPQQLYEVLAQHVAARAGAASTNSSTPRSPHDEDHPDRRRQPQRA
jgi:twitching motility two-component system response regulator PilG